jgi:hypothetical protein
MRPLYAKLGDDSGRSHRDDTGRDGHAGVERHDGQRRVRIFGPLNTKLCPGLEIYVDAATTTNGFVIPLEDSLPGQVNEIPIAFTAGGSGDSFEQVAPTASLDVQLHNNSGGPDTSNLYVYCTPSGG